MATFGELIDTTIPVLINFHRKDEAASASLNPVLNDLASNLKNKAKVIKIDIDENRKLVEALKIDKTPTLVIYKNGEMVWRVSEMKSGEELAEIVSRYL